MDIGEILVIFIVLMILIVIPLVTVGIVLFIVRGRNPRKDQPPLPTPPKDYR